jgi:hypothetical protein
MLRFAVRRKLMMKRPYRSASGLTRWAACGAVAVLGALAPVATSRAQDVGPIRSGRSVIVDSGDAVTITNGEASIKLEKDGTITLKGTNIVVEGGAKLGACAPTTTPRRNASEVF